MKIERVGRTNPQGPVLKSITFTAGGTGANAAETDLYTVTGAVLVVYILPYCTVNLDESAGTPSLELGVNNITDTFVAATTATAIDAGEFWITATPTADAIALVGAVNLVLIEENISCTVGGTNNISAGAIDFAVYWLPISSDGNVVAA